MINPVRQERMEFTVTILPNEALVELIDTMVRAEADGGAMESARAWRVTAARELARREHEHLRSLILAGKWNEILKWRDEI